MNDKGIVIAFLPLILAAIIILIIMALFGILFGLFIPVILLGASVLFFYFAYQSKNDKWRVGWAIAGVLALIFVIAPSMFSLVGQPTQTQGVFQGMVQDYAVTVNQDTSFKFRTTTNVSFAGWGWAGTNLRIVRKIDNANPSMFNYSQTFTQTSPYSNPPNELILQNLYSIPYSELKQFGNGKHIITFQYKGFTGDPNNRNGIICREPNQRTKEWITSHWADNLSISGNCMKVLDYPNSSWSSNCTSVNWCVDEGQAIQMFGYDFFPTQGEINFEIWIDDDSCQEIGGNMEVYEAYSAGQTISLQSFRYPFQAFCYQRPLRITDIQGTKLRQGLEEYALLLNGSTMTIPIGEVWVFTYMAKISPDIPIVCPEGSVYDSAGHQCVITPPVVFSCSGNGIFDPVQQVCVIQPESRIVCEMGVYNTELQKCVYFVPANQTEVVCPAGSEVTITPEGITKCVFEGHPEYVCETGHLNLEKTPPTCEVNPLVDITVIKLPLLGEINYINFLIMIVAGLVIVFTSIILILLLVKKK